MLYKMAKKTDQSLPARGMPGANCTNVMVCIIIMTLHKSNLLADIYSHL